MQKYKGQFVDELPNVTEFGYHERIFKLDEGQHIEERFRTYVRYEVWWKSKTVVGFIFTNENRRKRSLEWKANYLEKHNHVFRGSPVPHTGYHYRQCTPKRQGGFRSEHDHNVMCENELNHEYGNLVRRKRAQTVRAGFDWDFFYRSNRDERSWKRSKKRKQWM